MRRAELKVGDELLHANPRDFDTNHTGDRVVVLAVEPYTRDNWRRGEDRFQAVRTGNGVLVEMFDGTYHDRPKGRGRKNVVQLAHLRGPYAEVMAELDRRKAEVTRMYEAHVAAKNAASARRLAAVGRARAFGLDVHDDWRGQVVVNVAELEKLLGVLDQLAGYADSWQSVRFDVSAASAGRDVARALDMLK